MEQHEQTSNFVPKLWETGTETYKMLETVYVNEAVLLRNFDMIKELAAANCSESENMCKCW
jgi:hypothetical protein